MPVVELNLNRIKKLISGNVTKKRIIDSLPLEYFDKIQNIAIEYHLADSKPELAKDLRVLIRNKVKDGHSNKEIYNFLTERYGDFILLKPALKTNTIALWFLPFIFLLIGILFIYKHNKKS